MNLAGQTLDPEADAAPCRVATRTEVLESKEGLRLVVAVDEPAAGEPVLGRLLVAPGYGETRLESLPLAYRLAACGFGAMRYDATHHAGESDGDIAGLTLSRFTADMRRCAERLAQEPAATQIGIVARSLSTRSAIRLAATAGGHLPIAVLILIAPIVNLSRTLFRIYGEDVFHLVRQGEFRPGTTYDILGHEVRGAFLIDALEQGYHSLSRTLSDLASVHCPVHFLVGEEDPWSTPEEIELARQQCPALDCRVVPLRGAHGLATARSDGSEASAAVARRCLDAFGHEGRKVSRTDMPALARQYREERARRPPREFDTDREREFWEEYLASYRIIFRSRDFRRYLTKVLELLELPAPGRTVLDAGCGNGHLGALLHERGAARHDQPPMHYVAIDFAPKALDEALGRHASRLATLRDPRTGKLHVRPWYGLLDLEAPLPFADGTFDRICLSLVLSYLQEPAACLKELARLLRPGGRIMVSSLCPEPDFSTVFRRFLQSAGQREEIEEARQLMTAAGRICSKQRGGLYRFFTSQELQDMLHAAGLQVLSTQLALAGQVHFTIAEAPATRLAPSCQPTKEGT